MLFALALCTLLAASGQSDRFIVLSEFQVWADAAGPEVFKELNRQYIESGRSHVFKLYPRYDNFVWEFPRMARWVDEAVALGAFNVFCLGDDTRTAKGHLFAREGVNPALRDVFFRTISYAHQKGLLVAVEPVTLPAVRDTKHFEPWLASWLGPQIPETERADIVKLSIEWFGAYQDNPRMAEEVEAFFTACCTVRPEVLVYIDSIGGRWRRPQPFHRWLLHRFPGTILSHYLNTSQVDAFRSMGARNLMVQINPSESAETGGQFFIYHDATVRFLKDVVRKRIRYLSLAGVNFGYSRYNYELFLEVVRPHLKLARSVEELRGSLREDVVEAATARPVFGEAPPGCGIRRLASIADGEIGPRFEGAYTHPFKREPVRATFGIDLGGKRILTRVSAVPCLHPDEGTYVATDLRLEYRSNGKWRVLPGGRLQGNRKRELSIEFDRLEADAVRIVIERETDDGKGNYRACCQELAVR